MQLRPPNILMIELGEPFGIVCYVTIGTPRIRRYAEGWPRRRSEECGLRGLSLKAGFNTLAWMNAS